MIAAERWTTAFMFPGQGAQVSAMGVGLAALSPAFASRMRELLDVPGCPGSTLAHDWEHPDRCGAPDRADHSQPTLLAMGLGLVDELARRGVLPDAAMGHSVGEIGAAAACGVFGRTQHARLVDARRRAMAAPTPEGAMAAVLGSVDEVESFLVDGAVIGAVNSARQVVVSGSAPAVDETVARLRTHGRAVQPIRSDLPFHSPLCEPVAREFTRSVHQLDPAPPRCRLVSALTASGVTAAEARDPTFWGSQLMRQVRFAAACDHLLSTAGGERTLVVEVGPAGSCAAMIRRHPGVRSGQHRIVSALPSHGAGVEEARHRIEDVVNTWRTVMGA
jgi:acyl transferase domain-containing protein